MRRVLQLTVCRSIGKNDEDCYINHHWKIYERTIPEFESNAYMDHGNLVVQNQAYKRTTL